MDALQWMGAVRIRVQTADKNNHSNPHHKLTSLKIQKLYEFLTAPIHFKGFNGEQVMESYISSNLMSKQKRLEDQHI